jgi:hypothetical protein
MPEHHPVFRDGYVWVLRAQCATCIFRPGNIMDLERGRVKQMVGEATGIGGCIPCHKTIRRDDGVEPAICRGYFDAYAERVPAIALARACNRVAEQEVPDDWP